MKFRYKNDILFTTLYLEERFICCCKPGVGSLFIKSDKTASLWLKAGKKKKTNYISEDPWIRPTPSPISHEELNSHGIT